jgi:Alpha/beta hydrolase of unknown function (DUF900)
MANLFRAYQVGNVKISTYLIESSAPINVDDRPSREPVPEQLMPIDPTTAINQIAEHLRAAPDPNLVVMVHGFNNPEPAVLSWFASASAAIEADDCLVRRPGLVCVGYRWPSEHMGQPLRGTVAASPALLSGILWAGLLFLAVSLAYVVLGWAGIVHPNSLDPVAALTGSVAVFLIGTFVAGAVLRAIVYFRDGHRAANYGAADLIEIIRQIDRAIMERGGPRGEDNSIQLSFIGHSMGGFVVTNAIRALSDLFARDALRPDINVGIADAGVQKILPHLGNAFQLSRFVLASPDIPAETLLSNRANYLAASLRRFPEAYLFSNEGDEVLRQISTTVNFFSFPTRSWTHGYRLGNVEILSKDYGLIDVPAAELLDSLRVGYYTIRRLYHKLKAAHQEQVQDRLPEVFSYFDCTDYVDVDNEGRLRGLLTFANRTKRNDPVARMSATEHVRLLLAAFVYPKRPNIHGGYFDGSLCRQLIFRLACLGAQDTVACFKGLNRLSDECRTKQIRMWLSPSVRKLIEGVPNPPI